jgi:hypothetical protein
MHRGCGWVDPPSSHKCQRGKRPKSHHGDDKPSDERPEEALPTRGLSACGWSCSHIFRIIAWAGCRLRRTCARSEPIHRIKRDEWGVRHFSVRYQHSHLPFVYALHQ